MGFDREPEVVDRLPERIDRRDDVDVDEVVAGATGPWHVDVDDDGVGRVREQADEGTLGRDPLRIQPVDDRDDAVDHVGGVRDLDLDSGGAARLDGDV